MKGKDNKSTKLIAAILTAVAIMVPALSSFAVTDKEMEEAKTITAKAYLRYANNGSGYLDDVKATTMAELTSQLKDKEKENLKAFNSVSVPGDYAKWDKAKLKEFWSITFFTSPALSDEGKKAKSRVSKQIEAMTVSKPTATETAAPAATEPAATAAADTAAVPMPSEAAMEDNNILADQQDIEAANEEAAEATKSDSTGTWIYVVVLIILIGLVVWLMVYAANLMKKQPGGDKVTAEDNEELRDKARTALVKKNEEIADLQRRLHDEEGRSADIGAQLERFKLDNQRLMDQIEKLREENARLQSSSRQPNVAPVAPVAPAAPARRERVETPAQAAEPAKPILTELYLGRANTRGFFVRADRRISAGNTIFHLNTSDGLVGTFRVVDHPAVLETALTNPTEYLLGGCTGDDLEDTVGVRRIVTESDGTAIFENGYWKVLRKTRIRYE
jgi:hypothetical protein